MQTDLLCLIEDSIKDGQPIPVWSRREISKYYTDLGISTSDARRLTVKTREIVELANSVTTRLQSLISICLAEGAVGLDITNDSSGAALALFDHIQPELSRLDITLKCWSAQSFVSPEPPRRYIVLSHRA